MPARFVDFGWSVCSSGYEWRDIQNGDTVRNLLVPKLIDGSYTPKPYDPFDSRPDLFRLFCGKEITKTTVLEFANRYGPLGWSQEAGCDPIAAEAGVIEMYSGESLAAWKEAHARLRTAVRLWDAIQVRDVRALNNRIRFWFRGKMYRLSPLMYHDRTYVEAYGDSLQEDKVPQDLMDFAEHLSLNPNDKGGRKLYLLVGKAVRLLQYTVNLRIRHLTRAALLWDTRDLDCAIHVVPCNLLGAMWLQLAVEITALRESPKCQECGEYFIAKRAKAKYCSTRCRVRNWRRAKEPGTGAAPC